MSKAKQDLYNKMGANVVEALKLRHFDAYYVETKEEALEKVMSLIPNTDTVAWGGSETLEVVGVINEVKNRGYKVIDRDIAKTPEEKKSLMKQSLMADTYLMSSNAISADGQLFNIDGNGNRVGALVYGPESVIIVAGMNKVEPTVEAAVTRAKYLAAPMNAQRFGMSPCTEVGKCCDCLSEKSICAQMLQTRLCKPTGRIKVVLVGEDLGM